MRSALAHGLHAHPRAAALGAAAVLLFGTVPGAAAHGGVKTSQAAMLDSLVDGVSVEALITVGETAGDDGYRFEAIPDGISLRLKGNGTAEVFVNHETARVPFPYAAVGTPPTTANGQNDFDNAQLSRLMLNQKSAGVLTGKLVITSDQNYQRFCSNYLATAKEGFDRELLFTNEETPDWVNRTGKAWPATVGAATAREGGVVVAYDPKTGKSRAIWGMGRHNHENSVAIPGYEDVVLMSGDDTFTNNPSQSQVYAYKAEDADAVWNDQGSLWAFKSTTTGYTKYEDFAPGSTAQIDGEFVEVPRLIATGRKADGTELMSATVPASLGGPFDPPPNDGSWQRDPVTGIPVDGPQWVLEKWSRDHGVFAFVRVEDIAYDKRPGMSNTVYIVDSGRGTAPVQPPPPADPVPTFGPGISTNGRVWKMVLDPNDPTKAKLSILIDGDGSPVKTRTEIHQPDNIESTPNALYIQEDPGGSQQFPATSVDPNRTTARVWQYDLAAGTKRPILAVDQSLDEGTTDKDPATTRGNLGSWESTGIVDASAAFGPGAFLINVQAHSLFVEVADGDDNFTPAGADFLDKREGGQMLLVRVTGG
ncbi:MAG TPA: hypothetical protein VFN41_10555 [Candidatus Limnocylindrales bacterium]|nr:hypothetical protein [Candidatus Limnocylindrales bacterium]